MCTKLQILNLSISMAITKHTICISSTTSTSSTSEMTILARDIVQNEADNRSDAPILGQGILQRLTRIFSKAFIHNLSSKSILQTQALALENTSDVWINQLGRVPASAQIHNNDSPSRNHHIRRILVIPPIPITNPLPNLPSLGQNDQQQTKRPLLARLVSNSQSSTRVYIIQTPRNRATVLKVSTDALNLQRQFCVQVNVGEIFRTLQHRFKYSDVRIALPHVPVCFSFYPTLSSFPDGNSHGMPLPLPILSSLDISGSDAEAAAAYAMQFILPFQDGHAKYLIRRHLARHLHNDALSSVDDESYHFLGTLCLGANSPPSDSYNSNLHDRSIYVDHLMAEGVDVSSIAATMGAALAIFHWKCGLDARGIKFLLGRDAGGYIQIWVVDFGHCSVFPHTRTAVNTQLTDAIMQYPLRWPRLMTMQLRKKQGSGLRQGLKHQKEMWARFRFTYLEVSHFVLSNSGRHVQYLPDLFLHTLEMLRGEGQLCMMTAKQ